MGGYRSHWLRGLAFFCALVACNGSGNTDALPPVDAGPSGGDGPGPGGYGDSPEVRSPLATGYRHTCTIVAPGADGAGSVKCWGDNLNGQLGTGDNVPSALPKAMSGAMNDAIALAAGDAHTCALTKSGGVKCWGRGNEGQIAAMDKSDATSPRDVAELKSGVSMIAAGSGFSCAIHHGVAKCWGDNRSKQVGYETPGALESTVPMPVSGLTERVTFIGAGPASSCAVTAEGKAKCWGGALGLVPAEVKADGALFTTVTVGGESACGLTTAGAVMCWEIERTMTASARAGLESGVYALSGGETFWCALLSSGTVKCWGANERGQLGVGNFMASATGSALEASDATAIDGGHSHACVQLASGKIKCWGWNAYGQLGLGTSVCQSVPAELSKVNGGATEVAISTTHGCAITNAGAVECWGRNESGQLGTGDLASSVLPRQVTGLSSGATTIAVGTSFSCAAVGGGVKCWGKNNAGQLGVGSTTRAMESTPKDVSGLTSAPTALTAGFEHVCAIVGSAAKCWGRNYEGQLGNGRGGQESVPGDVTGLQTGVTALRAGHSHTCAVVNGAAKCWGLNSQGQLGIGVAGQLDFKFSPQNVLGLSSGVTAVAAGKAHTCAIVNGGAKCWGVNLRGQVGVQQGVGSSTPQSTPVDVATLSNGVTAVAAGNEHSCAVVTGGVQCWGSSGAYGCIQGVGSGVSSTPRVIAELATGVTGIFAAEQVSIARRATGAFMGWGQSIYGELGLGYGELVPEPADVEGL